MGARSCPLYTFKSSSVQLNSLVTPPGCPLNLKLCMNPTVCQSKYVEHSVEKSVCIFGLLTCNSPIILLLIIFVYLSGWFMYFGLVSSLKWLLLRKLKYFDHLGLGQPAERWRNRSPSFRVLMHSMLMNKLRLLFASDSSISTCMLAPT